MEWKRREENRIEEKRRREEKRREEKRREEKRREEKRREEKRREEKRREEKRREEKRRYVILTKFFKLRVILRVRCWTSSTVTTILSTKLRVPLLANPFPINPTTTPLITAP